MSTRLRDQRFRSCLGRGGALTTGRSSSSMTSCIILIVAQPPIYGPTLGPSDRPIHVKITAVHMENGNVARVPFRTCCLRQRARADAFPMIRPPQSEPEANRRFAASSANACILATRVPVRKAPPVFSDLEPALTPLLKFSAASRSARSCGPRRKAKAAPANHPCLIPHSVCNHTPEVLHAGEEWPLLQTLREIETFIRILPYACLRLAKQMAPCLRQTTGA